jgi:hypothetical protein
MDCDLKMEARSAPRAAATRCATAPSQPYTCADGRFNTRARARTQTVHAEAARACSAAGRWAWQQEDGVGRASERAVRACVCTECGVACGGAERTHSALAHLHALHRSESLPGQPHAHVRPRRRLAPLPREPPAQADLHRQAQQRHGHARQRRGEADLQPHQRDHRGQVHRCGPCEVQRRHGLVEAGNVVGDHVDQLAAARLRGSRGSRGGEQAC